MCIPRCYISDGGSATASCVASFVCSREQRDATVAPPGKTQNVMTEEHVGRIVETYRDRAEVRGRMKGYLKELGVDA